MNIEKSSKPEISQFTLEVVYQATIEATAPSTPSGICRVKALVYIVGKIAAAVAEPGFILDGVSTRLM